VKILTPNACKPQDAGMELTPIFMCMSLNARTLLAHRACATLARLGLGRLGLSHTLGQNLGILVLSDYALAGCKTFVAQRSQEVNLRPRP
jgi:hypothetical protein